MKGIYLTKQGKQEIEAKIAELEEDLKEESNPFIRIDVSAELNTYKRILFYATILPVEESWEGVSRDMSPIDEVFYPNGVIIIQPKQ
jgi:hypothetical protein